MIKAIVILGLTCVLMACAGKDKLKQSTSDNPYVSLPSGLQYQVIAEGEGTPAGEGDTVLIFESASYRDGTLLFTNENSGQPAKVLIGGHQATDGEDEGLRGMKVGEIRKMIIPPAVSRRSEYPYNLSPDSTLVVKVILFKIL